MDIDAYLEDAPDGMSEEFVTTTIKHHRALLLRAIEVANLMLGRKSHYAHGEDDVRNLEWDESGDGKTVFIAFNSQHNDECLRFPRKYLWFSDESIRVTEEALKAAEAARKLAIVRQTEQERAERREAEQRKLYEQLKAKFEQKGA